MIPGWQAQQQDVLQAVERRAADADEKSGTLQRQLEELQAAQKAALADAQRRADAALEVERRKRERLQAEVRLGLLCRPETLVRRLLSLSGCAPSARLHRRVRWCSPWRDVNPTRIRAVVALPQISHERSGKTLWDLSCANEIV